MDFLELFWESLGTLTVNKLRTALAILGKPPNKQLLRKFNH